MTSPNRVLFSAYTPAAGIELWVSDGTTLGTTMVKDIFPGKSGSAPEFFTQLGTQVVFGATDSVHGVELWITDGTAAGTSMLKDINPGSGSGLQPQLLTSGTGSSLRPAGGKLVFLGNDGTTGLEPWVTDGTAAGTYQLKDINAGSSPSSPSFFESFGDRQLFQATDGLHRAGPDDGLHGTELWITDGTSAGTTLVADIDPGVYGSGSPKNITDLGTGLAVFSANGGGNIGRELWVTDGTAAGTSLLKDITPGAYKPSNPGPATRVGNTGLAVFAAVGTSSHQAAGGGNEGSELWVTDGTAAGTSMLRAFSNGYESGSTTFVSGTASGRLQTLGNEVLFTAKDAGASALWATDGTAAGTVKLSVDGVYVQGLANGGSGFTPLGGGMLFWSGSGLTSRPWITDGTPAGTLQLSATASLGNDQGFAVVGNKAVFSGSSAGGQELWVTDGTPGGTALLKDINPLGPSTPNGFAVIGGKALFQATTSANGAELWESDGTYFGTFQVKDINTNTFHSSTPSTLTAVTLPCFAAGTRLRTPDGERAVETLRPGDLVLTARGQARPVRWVGHRGVVPMRHNRPEDVSPVRIAAHAFGPGLPHAPLFLSPDHAVFADGVLVPVRYLVNGTTVARVGAARVTWYHIELAAPDGAAIHDVVLAHGLPSESYLDTGNRDAFANGGGATALHPDFAREAWHRHACAKLVLDGAELVALRSWLLERADLLGPARTADPALAFTIDGRPAHFRRHGAWHEFAVPAGARGLWLASRATIPAEAEAEGTDTRRLGVAATALRLDGAAAPLGHARLGTGWHAPEPALRWSGGTAMIDLRGLASIALALHFAPAYRDDTVAHARAG